MELGSIVVIILFAIITISIFSGDNKTNDESRFSTSKISNLVPNSSENISISQASTQIGKSINEVKNETENIIDKKANSINENKNETNNSKVLNENKNATNKASKESISNKTTSTNIKKVENVVETNNADNKEPVFIKPVEGEIIKEYAKDKLVYSETLKEWITHNGIDIKAEKTSVVKAAASGRVCSIKNDPRYGLTVTIEHTNGYKTVYSNLLTAEFVTEGEEIESGQTIGTVGNTSNFEILDEEHLHFEILKDNQNIDPSIYIQ